MKFFAVFALALLAVVAIQAKPSPSPDCGKEASLIDLDAAVDLLNGDKKDLLDAAVDLDVLGGDCAKDAEKGSLINADVVLDVLKDSSGGSGGSPAAPSGTDACKDASGAAPTKSDDKSGGSLINVGVDATVGALGGADKCKDASKGLGSIL